MQVEDWQQWVRAAYTETEASQIFKWQNDKSIIASVCSIAHEIQNTVPLRPGECRYWTALWVTRVRDELGLPAVQVGGDLHAYRECVYKVDVSDEFLDHTHRTLQKRWPGHSWFALGTWIGDISLTITSLTPTCQRTLVDVVRNHFSNEGGLVCVPFFERSSANSFDLSYTPRGVYSPTAMLRHIEAGRFADASTK